MWSKKKRYSILLCIVVLLLTGCSVFTRKETHTNTSDNRIHNYPVVLEDDKENTQVKVTYGLNSYAKMGKDMRLKIEVHTSVEPFEGYLQIEVPFDDASTKYNQKISVDSNTDITYELKVPVIYENIKFMVRLLDKEQDIEVSQVASVQASKIYDVQYIGILNKSMQTEAVVSKGKMQVFQLYSKKLEDAFDNLNLIDCILVNEEEINQLDDSVALQLEEWLQNGGTLLIEDSDKNNADSTGDYGFGRYIIVPEMKDVDQLVEFVEDLGLNPKLFLSRLTDDSVKASINAEDVSKIPNIARYVAVFLLYIIVIGPVLYAVLKKRNRRVWYLSIVPIISILFVVVVYGVGKVTRVENSYLRYVTITQIAQNGYTNEATYFAVVNPSKTTLEVQADNAKNLQPLYTTSDNYEVSTDNKRVNVEFSMNVESTTGEENIKSLSTVCTASNIIAFQPLYLKVQNSYSTKGMDKQTDQSEELLTYADYRLLGSYTNTTGMDLANACIVSNQTLIELGDLQSGESVELEECQYDYIPSYDLLYTNALDGRIKNLAKDDSVETNSKYNLMQYVLNEWTTVNSNESYLIAFTEDLDTNTILSNSDINQDELSSHMIIKELGIDYNMEDGDIFQPTIKEYMSVVSGDYYQELDMIESDSLTVDYAFGDEVIKQIEYSKYYNTEFYVDDTNAADLWIGFYGTAYFYNRRTGEYEKVIISNEETVITRLGDYLGDSNVLRVRYEVSQNSANSNLVTIPKLTAIKKGD